MVTSIRQGARKAVGRPSALMQLPTPEDCMAIMARLPPSQQPVAMPMPSSSVESVTRRMPLSASIMLRSWVSPPSGTVQTVAMFARLHLAEDVGGPVDVGGAHAALWGSGSKLAPAPGLSRKLSMVAGCPRVGPRSLSGFASVRQALDAGARLNLNLPMIRQGDPFSPAEGLPPRRTT